jgi:hypothetical protein
MEFEEFTGSGSGEDRLVRPGRGITIYPGGNPLQFAEAFLGAFFAFPLGLVVVVFGGDLSWIAYSENHLLWVGQVWFVAAVLEIILLYWLKISLELLLARRLPYPFAPAFAMRQWNWPRILRPLVMAWWLAHFLIGVAAAVILNNLIILDGPHDHSRTVRIVAFLVTGFTITYSANMYLLLALRAIGFSERIVRLAWKWRLLIDIGVIVLAGLFPF